MLVRLDKEYTSELNDSESSTYKELESRINSVVTALLAQSPILTCIFRSWCSNVYIIKLLHSWMSSIRESQGFKMSL